MTAGVHAERLIVHHHDQGRTELDDVYYWLNRSPDGTRVVLVDEDGVYVGEIENVLRTETA